MTQKKQKQTNHYPKTSFNTQMEGEADAQNRKRTSGVRADSRTASTVQLGVKRRFEKREMPTMEELTTYMNQQTHRSNKHDIARRFGIKGGESRAELKKMIRTLREKGAIEVKGKGQRFSAAGTLPAQGLIEITGLDSMGDLVARPFKWSSHTPAPQIIVTKDKLSPPAGVGDVVQARLKPVGNKLYEAEALRRVSSGENHMVGVYRDGQVQSVDRRLRDSFTLTNAPRDLKENDIIIVDIPTMRTHNPVAEFVRKIGSTDEAFAPTLIAIYLHAIPVAFTESTEKEAQHVKVPLAGKNRLDMRSVNFVTIDGADAKDFDDAVWAEPDNDPVNKGGFHIMVGIADVAHYVTPGSAMDLDARLRGNSVYFPDRVVPMLPFELSAGVCSLKPNEPRAAMVCEIWINSRGDKIRHEFKRALIQSKRRLTYDEVQAHMEGKMPIVGLEEEIKNLEGAYRALSKNRQMRGVLEIDMPERQVILSDTGEVLNIKFRRQLDAHKLIEELMILSNVAAAETLEDYSVPTMYRIHDRPTEAKVEVLKNFLSSIGMACPISPASAPKDFNDILVRAKGSAKNFAINEFVLRSQCQAVYSPENVGHFGLALERYAHFTSPIRRYSDVMVHRALITALKAGEDGLSTAEMDSFEQIAQHISNTERQAASAEQDALDRYTAAYLRDKVGQQFAARISSVTAFGLFVSLDVYGADGLIPMRALRGDYYEYDDRAQKLVGRSTGIEYTVGEVIQVILKECTPVTGGMLFDILNPKRAGASEGGERRQRPQEYRPHRGGGGKGWTKSRGGAGKKYGRGQQQNRNGERNNQGERQPHPNPPSAMGREKEGGRFSSGTPVDHGHERSTHFGGKRRKDKFRNKGRRR